VEFSDQSDRDMIMGRMQQQDGKSESLDSTEGTDRLAVGGR